MDTLVFGSLNVTLLRNSKSYFCFILVSEFSQTKQLIILIRFVIYISLTSFRKIFAEHQRQNSHQFNQNVQTWARSIFHRITYRVTHYGCFMNLTSFFHHLPHISHQTCLYIFFSVIPSTSSIRGRDSHLDSTCYCAR